MEELAAIFEAIIVVYVIGAILKFVLRFFFPKNGGGWHRQVATTDGFKPAQIGWLNLLVVFLQEATEGRSLISLSFFFFKGENQNITVKTGWERLRLPVNQCCDGQTECMAKGGGQ